MPLMSWKERLGGRGRERERERERGGGKNNFP